MVTGAMGAMNVGGGSTTDLVDREEEEEGGGEEEERALEVAGDEATGRTGVRKEREAAEDGMLGGTAPPGAEGFVFMAAAAAGELGPATAAAMA